MSYYAMDNDDLTKVKLTPYYKKRAATSYQPSRPAGGIAFFDHYYNPQPPAHQE